MIKSQLIDQLARLNPHLRRHDIKKVVEAIFGEISDALVQGGRVEIRGFGAFSLRRRRARTGRNPKNGKSVSVPEKRMAAFKAGKELKLRLNGYSDV